MDRNSKIVLIALGLLAGTCLLVWMIVAGAFNTPGDAGWVYDYQTLIGGAAALGAAVITVYVMHRQGERQRSDDADRALTRYATAILNVMKKCQDVTTASQQDEAPEDVKAKWRELEVATDSPEIAAAMMDGVMGVDKTMVVLFCACCRYAALARTYQKTDERHENIVWPLYMALTNGITRRQAMLREGLKVSVLYELSTIDQAEYQKAYVEGRAPKLD